jgi:adenylate cyclase
MIRRPTPPTIIALVGGILAAVWVAFLAVPHLGGWRSPLDALEATLADLRLLMAGPTTAPADVVIVAIDDATLAETGVGFPLPRARLADIIRNITAAGPKALAVDILLLDAKDGATDAALAEALARTPSVIAAAGRFTDARNVAGLPQTTSELWPQPVFANAASVGLVNIVTDSSGAPRHIPLLYFTSHGLQPSLVLQAAALYLGAQPEIAIDQMRIGTRAIPTDFGFHLPLRSIGPTGSVRTVPARDFLSPTDNKALTSKVAVLGFTASAVGDRFVTPFDPVTPGVEVLAGAIGQLIGNGGLQRTAAIRNWDVAATGTLAVGGAIAVAYLPVSFGVSAAAGALALWLGAVCLLCAEGYWFSAALPLAGSLPPVIGVSLARHLYERRQAWRSRRAAEMLRQFHPPALGDRIAHDPAFLREPVTQHLAIVFVDLAGFTQMSEALGLTATRDLLKRFHSCVAHEVEACSGVVLNYMGDGAMAAFGLPEPHQGDADNALKAAFALVAAVHGLTLPTDRTSGSVVRVGLHFGPAVVSRLGHETHQQISISGDSVNLTSRLLEVAKVEAATIAASSDLLSAMTSAAEPAPDDRRTVSIRGRTARVEVALWAFPLPARGATVRMPR